MPSPLPAWHSARHRALHMTIRDIDCADFDVEKTIATFRRWNVTLFSFFAGGYVTTYPSRLPWQRVSPHLAPGRDLCGELITAAHRAGMIAFPMIDLGELPLDLAVAHPEWAAQQADGSPYLKTDGIAVSCPVGAYRRELARELVAELRDRYGRELDGIKWGGASYGFPPGIDHNPLAVSAFLAASGTSALPATAKDPAYAAWAHHVIAENVAHLRRVVHEIAGVPVVGNSVWSLGEGLALEDLTPGQDFTQVEVQTRTFTTPDAADVCWERFTAAAETARYASACCQNPPWVVASYFLAWPWRRVAVPFAEQKLYVAQLAAHGASPMVNLTTGSPDHHDDPRGFPAIEELYGFIARHDAWYQADTSAARVAIVYDHSSASAARRSGDIHRRYLDELHTCEETLDQAHVPYDVLSTQMLRTPGAADRYRVLLLPAPQALDADDLTLLARLRSTGTALVVTGQLPVHLAASPDLPAAFGLTSISPARPFHQGAQRGQLQAYVRPVSPGHPLLTGLPSPLLAVSGHFHPVTPVSGSSIPFQRAEPFRLFPEGIAYTEAPDPAEPMAVCTESPAAPGGARAVVFPFELGRAIRRTGHPDARRLLVNALAWASRDTALPVLTGSRDVLVSLRRSAPGLALHLINATGRTRHLTEFTPLVNLPIALPCDFPPARVTQASTGRELPFTRTDGLVHLTLPSLTDYDLVQLHRT